MYVEPGLRRQKAEEAEYDYGLILAFLIFFFALAFAADQLGFTNIARAEEKPTTQAEICKAIYQNHTEVRGVSQEKLQDYCRKHGVDSK